MLGSGPLHCTAVALCLQLLIHTHPLDLTLTISILFSPGLNFGLWAVEEGEEQKLELPICDVEPPLALTALERKQRAFS